MLIDQIQSDLKEAQLSRNERTVSTLRLLLAEIKNVEISKGSPLEDSDIILVVQREVKKRREAAAGFRQGAREDSAIEEEAEAKILENYLPTQLSNEELTKLVEEAITELGASSISDMGKVIGEVMGKVGGKADGSRVSGLVKEKLAQ